MIKKILTTILFLVPFFSLALLQGKNSPDNAKVDIVIFSYNRPLQLYACLESLERHFTGYNEIHVIYRTSQEAYETGYQIVMKRFAKVQYHVQSSNPQEDFKPLVLYTVNSKTSPCSYIMFGVDDMIVTDSVDLEECTRALENHKAWGFFLRLGKNISKCYMQNNKKVALPPLKKCKNKMLLWQFATGKEDWKYPNNVDMTIYRKKDIQSFLTKGQYVNPNTFEALWSQRWADFKKKGLCFDHSKVLNIPINLVHQSYRNRYNHSYTVEELLVKFQNGLKIDISKFYKIKNDSVHVEYEPEFISRDNFS